MAAIRHTMLRHTMLSHIALRCIVIGPLALLIALGLFWFISELINSEPTHIPSESEALRLDFLKHLHTDTKQDIEEIEDKPLKEEEPEEIFTPDMKLALPDLNIELDSFDLPTLSNDLAISTPLATQGLALDKSTKASSNNRELMAVRENALSYPPMAQRKRIEGWVTFSYVVNEAGKVENIEIIESSPPRVFDRVVIKEVSKWKYMPRLENSKAVATKVVERKYVFSL